MSEFDFNLLRKSFDYDIDSGILTRTRTNKVVKTLDAYGYIQVGYLGKVYKAHRLIWAICYAKFPYGYIDHINGMRSDNRLCNLRDVSKQENSHNQKKPNKRNTSGYLGVCRNKKLNKWQSEISVNGRSIYLGLFNTPEEAHQAYLEAKKIYHPSVI